MKDAADAAQTVRRLRRLARLMDSSIGLPGTRWRIGLDPLLGLIPGVGDAVGIGASLWIVSEARRLGLRGPVIGRMLGNVALDGLIGTIPLLGDLFDAGYKANERNMDIIERELRKHAPAARKPPPPA